MKVLPALYQMERRGIAVDEQAARQFEMFLVNHLDTLEERCVALAGRKDFNPNSSEQIAKALKRRGADLTFARKTKTGLSMDAESLATVDDELAKAVLAFRAEFKNLSTYVRPMLHGGWEPSLQSSKAPFIHDGRIHPNFRQVGARTGRMSASDPNIQNWPRDDLRLRYLLRAEPGYKLVGADLDSIELRLFAAYVKWGRFRDAIIEGDDLHTQTADLIGLSDRKRATGVETARQRGKQFNYMMLYSAGVRGIRRQLGVPQDQARALLQRYHYAYPEVGALRNEIEWKIEDRGYIKTAWGRRQRIDVQDAYRAVNYLIQGTAADLLKASIIRLHDEGWPLVAAVHDELLMHVPEEDAEDARRALVRALTEHPRITEQIPLEAEAKVYDRWSDAKDPTFTPEFVTIKG